MSYSRPCAVNTKPPVPIGESEYEAVIALWEAAGLPYKPTGRDSREAFARQLEGNMAAFGVYSEDGRLIGVVLATHDERKGWINRLAVHPDFRRRGVGRALIRAAEGWLREQGIGIFAALIEPGNEVSLAVFQAAGYVDWPGIHYVSKRDREDV